MKRNTGCAALIILGLMLAGCGSPTAADGMGTGSIETEAMETDAMETAAMETAAVEGVAGPEADSTETVGADEEQEVLQPETDLKERNVSMAAPADSGDIRRIHMDNPSWDYYCAKEPASVAAPVKLTKLTEEANQITDTEEWFEKNSLSLNAENSERYSSEIFTDENGGNSLIQVKDGETGEVYELDFSDYQYAGDFKQSEKDFVKQQIRYAQVNDNILYLSIGHRTYADSSPHNAYVAAVDLAEKKLLWKSQPLVSNAANFVIRGDVLLCGYGFTAEPDYIYQLDLASGRVIDKTPVKSKADYLILKDGTLYVRTYNTDYTFRIE